MTIKKYPIAKFAFRLSILTLYFLQGLQAQSYIADITKLSVENGLSSRFVNTIHQDSQGFMWIGTRYGLNRYDGYEFKHYTSENSALASNSIKSIHEDNTQKLWIVHNNPYNVHEIGQIDVLTLQTGHIESFDKAFKEPPPVTLRDIEYLYSNAENELWISTRKGVLYRYYNNRFEPVFSTPKPRELIILNADNRYVSILADRKELFILDKQGQTVANMSVPTSEVGGISDTFWCFLWPKKKLRYFNSNEKEFQEFDVQSMNLPEVIFKSNSVRRISMNTSNDLIWWYQQDVPDIFFVFHPQKGVVFDLYPQIMPLLTYNNLQVIDMYFDTEDRTWVATQDGVFIINLKKNKFTKLLSGTSMNYSVRGIVEDNSGTIHINTYNSRILTDVKNRKTEKKDETVKEIWLGAHKDKKGNLWFSGQDPIIEKYDPLHKESQYYPYKTDKGTAPWSQWTIIRDKEGKIWTGSDSGLYTLDPETGLYNKFDQYNTFTQLRESAVYHLRENEKGIWIAAASGLYLLEPGKGITARYATDENTPHYIPYNHLLHSHQSSSDVLWLATLGGGLIRFNPEDGSYQRFTTVEGLSSNIIYAVYEDDYGKLWLPSNYGLMQFDKKTHRVNTYLMGDGITHNEFNTASHYKATDGKLYFGGLSGVTVFDPEDFTKEKLIVSPLQMTGCHVLNGKTGKLTDKTTEVATSGALVITPSDKSFIIEFTLLNYENVNQNTYTYTIEGLDNDWNNIEGNNLRINTLPYGRYTLHIKGKGLKGGFSKNDLSILILVLKPFYKKNGFILACIVVLGLMIYGLFRWRLHNLKQAKIQLQETIKQRTSEIIRQKDKIEQQAGKLQELDKAKSRFFANISHELRTPLTLIIGHLKSALKGQYGKVGKQLQANLEVSQNNSRRLLTMIEEILELSKMEAGKLEIHEKPVKIYMLIDRICDTFRSYIKEKNIFFTRRINLAPDRMILLDEKKFEKIVINLLANAAKFTEANGSITVSAEEISAGKDSENMIKLSVQDSGIGISPEDLPYIFDRFYQAGDKNTPMKGGTGIGLALSKELAELLGGSLRAESAPGEGSIFTLIFPKKEIAPLAEKDTVTATEKPVFPHTVREKQEEIPHLPYKKQKPVILIVEDHPQMRNYIQQQITGNYHVLKAEDGIEAMQILKKQPIDLILSDVMMPRMDGFQLLSALKANPATENIPVIMLTARAAREDRLHALTIGVDDYLTKPFDEEELMARIRYSLRNCLKRQKWSARLSGEEKETLTASSQFLTKAETVAVRAMANHGYSVIDMAEDLNLSQRQLFRKIKAATGLSPLQFIREIRLQKARYLLENKEKETVAEVMYAVGFQKSDYFAKVYHKRFGKLPSSYFL